MLLGVSTLMLLPALAGCHTSQTDFANMSRDQQMNAMKPTAKDLAMGKAMAEKMHNYNPGYTGPSAKPGSTAPVAGATKP